MARDARRFDRDSTDEGHDAALAADPAVDEGSYLASYDASRWPQIGATVDIVCFTIRQGRLSVLLVQRAGHPHRGAWALPGGFVHPDEDLPDAAVRELAEETGVDTPVGHLEQLGTYGAPGRDPRMRVLSVAYLVFAADLPDPQAGSDAARARFWAIEDLDLPGTAGVEDAPRLAFDHALILADGTARARAKLEYSPLATTFLPTMFTLAELRRVYEAVWNVGLDLSNFRRKVLSTMGFVVPVDAEPQPGPRGGRPAALYRAGTARLLHPALLSPTSRAAALLDDPDPDEDEP
jgi:8-oxo-dGTP diphosphatase